MKEKKDYTTIGIISPGVYSFGGHDEESPERTKIIESIDWILNYHLQDKKLIALTSLNYGVEHDFARLCIKYDIPFRCYLPFQHQEKHWIKDDNYKDLLAQALSVEHLAERGFSGKKIIEKNAYISKHSNIIIYLPNRMKHNDPLLSKLLCSSDKLVYILKV